MRLYNEARAARKIRRQARFLTFTILFISISGLCFFASPSLRETLPDFVKEWFEEATPEEQKAVKNDRA